MFLVRREADRQAARELRAQGWSLRAIAHHLGASLGRTSEWVRDIEPADRAPAPDDTAPNEPLPVWKSGELRVCGRCRLTLPVELFGRMADDRQWWCRRCFRGYHRGRRPAARTRAVAKIEAARAYVSEHLRMNPCTDCGEQDVVVLEFDHIVTKRDMVSTLVARGAPLARLQQEIARCEVVCVNCHRRRTTARQGSRRMGAAFQGSTSRPLRIRNLEYLYAKLVESGCIDCGASDLVVLDFDHITDDKVETVSRLAHRECSLARLDTEIAKCVVRCANCHRRRTAAVFGYARAA